MTHTLQEQTIPATWQNKSKPLAIALSIVSVLLVVAIVLLALVVRNHQQARDARAAAREQSLAEARVTILDLDALSASTINADLERVLANSTGTFRTEFSNAETDLKKDVVTLDTVSSGTLISSGIVSAHKDSAVVLVAVDRNLSDSTLPKGTVAHDRWVVTLHKQGDRWLVSDLEPVS